jgi:staphylococcal nuclease domain-containing protein 1
MLFFLGHVPSADLLSQPWAYEAREHLRAFAVGKELAFNSTHSIPSEEVPKDFGPAWVGGVPVIDEMLKNGWVKCKEMKRDPTEEDTRRKELENEAKAAGKGVWNPHGPQVCRSLFPSGVSF